MNLPRQLSQPAYWRKCAPVLGMPVLIMSSQVDGLVNPKGKIVRLREPFGTADILLDSGETRYFISNDPYNPGVYWIKY